MALIQCPECGEQISDKAVKCVHCGHVFVEEPKKVCAECGAELEENATICANCGCPVETPEETAPQKVEVTNVSLKRPSKKKIIIGAIIAAAVIILAVIGILIGTGVKANKAVKYGDNLKSTSNLMLVGAAEAESCGNLIKSVWYNAIYEKSDATTDKYTKSGYWFVDDFNDALANLFSDEDFASRIEAIKSNQDSVGASMKDLGNPPDEWKEAYADLKVFYDAYLDLTNLAVSPTGSLQTFSSNFNDADSKASNAYNKMQMYFD